MQHGLSTVCAKSWQDPTSVTTCLYHTVRHDGVFEAREWLSRQMICTLSRGMTTFSL